MQVKIVYNNVQTTGYNQEQEGNINDGKRRGRHRSTYDPEHTVSSMKLMYQTLPVELSQWSPLMI